MRLLRIVGRGIAIIGVLVFLFFGYGAFALFSYAGEHSPLPPGAEFVPLIALLGLTMITMGVYLLRTFEEPVLLLTRAGEPTHIGEIWKKGKEPGLYLTSCGRIVSINQESSATAHVGYRISSSGHATCSDCATSEGRAILEFNAHGRMSDA